VPLYDVKNPPFKKSLYKKLPFYRGMTICTKNNIPQHLSGSKTNIKLYLGSHVAITYIQRVLLK